MNYLENKIKKDGTIVNGNLLDVGSFLNHYVDSSLIDKIANDFYNHFKNKGVTKVVTIESSGISFAVLTALKLNVDFVILKKGVSKIINDDVYKTKVKSTTKGNIYDLVVSSKCINDDDKILFVDDFLGTGESASSAIKLIKNNTDASIVGVCVAVENVFRGGRDKIDNNTNIYSIAKIKSLSDGHIEFM